MGLDMYLEGHKHLFEDWDNPERNMMEDGYRVKERILALGYWRKHPNLHGYIVQTFADGKDECQDIALSSEDIDKLIAAVKERRLPHTAGFFFGKSDGTEDEMTVDIAILKKAKAWLSNQQKGESRYVVYRASW